MDINIEEFSYADFLQLPKKERIRYSIIDLLDEKGNVWYDKPPAPRIKVAKLKLFSNTSRENLYLDFYNLNAGNREACYEFIIQHSIAYVERKKYDESKAPIFTVNDLLSYHDLYKIHLDFLIQEGSAEKLVRDTEQLMEGSGGMVEPSSPYLSYAYINKHLKRCHLRLELGGNKKAFDYECEDFLALCYFQLVDEVINQKKSLGKCIICNKLFKKNRGNHVYCSPKCSQVPDSRKKSASSDKIHQKLCELIDKWLGPKQESNWIDADRLAGDLSEEFSIGSVYQKDLDNQNISEGLRWQFKDNGISLSDNANVTIKRKGREWLITNENETSIVKKEKGKLNIIRKTFLLDKRSPAHSLGSYLKEPNFENKLKEEKKIIIQTREKRKNNEYKFLRI